MGSRWLRIWIIPEVGISERVCASSVGGFIRPTPPSVLLPTVSTSSDLSSAGGIHRSVGISIRAEARGDTRGRCAPASTGLSACRLPAVGPLSPSQTQSLTLLKDPLRPARVNVYLFIYLHRDGTGFWKKTRRELPTKPRHQPLFHIIGALAERTLRRRSA
jgi:hypothetical protein